MISSNWENGITTINNLYNFHRPTTQNTIYSQISQTLECEKLLNSTNEQINNKKIIFNLGHPDMQQLIDEICNN